MHSFCAVLALVALSSALQSQEITITPLGGASIPKAGNLSILVPGPPAFPGGPAGDSIPVTFSYGKGISLGALVELDFRGTLGAAALLTANLSSRNASLPDRDLDCGDCDSRIYGVAMLGTAQLDLARNARMHIGLGPELLVYSGGAVSTERYFLPPNVILIAPRSVLGGLGALGFSYGAPGAALRIQVAYRYSAPRYEERDKDHPQDARFSSNPLQEVVFSLGVEYQPWRRSERGAR